MYINEIPCKFIHTYTHTLLKSKPGYKTSISSNIHHFLETKASNIFSPCFLSYAIHYNFYRHPVGNFVKLDCTIWSSYYFEECSPFSITKSTNSFHDPALTRPLLPLHHFPSCSPPSGLSLVCFFISQPLSFYVRETFWPACVCLLVFPAWIFFLLEPGDVVYW